MTVRHAETGRSSRGRTALASGALALVFAAALGLVLDSEAQSKPDLRDPKLVAEGDAVFVKNCSVPYCHGKEGTTGRAPALRDRPWNLKELEDSVRNGVPNSSMPNWDDKLSERQIRAVIAYVLSLSSEGHPASSATARRPAPPAATAVAPVPESAAGGAVPESAIGRAARGEALFFQSNERGCAHCHAVDGKGGALGPDLSGSSRRAPRDLFRAIVLPGQRVAPEHRLLRITMKDGEKIAGLRHEETAAALRVYDLASLPPALRRLPKDQIATLEVEARSGMPDRYAELYTLREILDLVAFLMSSGAAAPARVTLLDIQP